MVYERERVAGMMVKKLPISLSCLPDDPVQDAYPILVGVR